MQLNVSQLTAAEHGCYYLHGEDGDALQEAAEMLLAAGDPAMVRLRVDVNELARIEVASKNGGLFAPAGCYALVRNAQSANVKQSEQLVKLASHTLPGNRLIICAAGMDWKKGLHKKLKALPHVAHCEFRHRDEQFFRRWFQQQLKDSNLTLDEDALLWASERLCGMRLAARKLIQRLQWYAEGSHVQITLPVVAELLGERAPDALDDWCDAVSMREHRAITLARRLLREQGLAAVQMLSWLSTRMQQLLMYRWFVAKGASQPIQAARVFGSARGNIAEASKCWRVSELTDGLQAIVLAEKSIKGASLEDDSVVLERLTLQLLGRSDDAG